MSDQPILRVVFFRTPAGDEPVRTWLKELNREDRKAIGEDVKLMQFRWPLGMPLIRKLEPGLWEVRSPAAGLRGYSSQFERERRPCCTGLSRNHRKRCPRK